MNAPPSLLLKKSLLIYVHRFVALIRKTARRPYPELAFNEACSSKTTAPFVKAFMSGAPLFYSSTAGKASLGYKIFADPTYFLLAKKIIELGADPNLASSLSGSILFESPILISLRNGNWALARAMLNALDALPKPDGLGSAAHSFNFSLYDDSDDAQGALSRLLALGANFNQWDSEEKTPLHWEVLTSRAYSERSLLTLIEAGANPSALDGLGHAPIYYAARRGNAEAFQLLFAYGSKASPRFEIGEEAAELLSAGMASAGASLRYQMIAYSRLLSLNVPGLTEKIKKGISCVKDPQLQALSLSAYESSLLNITEPPPYGLKPTRTPRL